MILPSIERFDKYANELMKVARYSSAYLIDDIEFKNGYIYEISQVIRMIKHDYQLALYNFNKGRGGNFFSGSGGEYRELAEKYIEEIKMELEAEKYGYEQLRKKDKSSYLNTQEYSGKGFVFYGKKSLKVVGGVVQTGLGVLAFRTGSTIRSHELRGMGILGVTTGISDAVEGVTDILYDFTDGEIDPINPIKHLSEKGFTALGADEGSGELTYDVVDFGVSVYFGFAVLTKFDHPKRIIHLPVETKNGLRKASFLDKLLTEKGVRLFRWSRADFKRKMFVSSKPMLVYKTGNLALAMYLLIDKYSNR